MTPVEYDMEAIRHFLGVLFIFLWVGVMVIVYLLNLIRIRLTEIRDELRNPAEETANQHDASSVRSSPEG